MAFTLMSLSSIDTPDDNPKTLASCAADVVAIHDKEARPGTPQPTAAGLGNFAGMMRRNFSKGHSYQRISDRLFLSSIATSVPRWAISPD